MEFNLLQPKLNCNFSHFKFEYKVSTPKKKKNGYNKYGKKRFKKKNLTVSAKH